MLITLVIKVGHKDEIIEGTGNHTENQENIKKQDKTGQSRTKRTKIFCLVLFLAVNCVQAHYNNMSTLSFLFDFFAPYWSILVVFGCVLSCFVVCCRVWSCSVLLGCVLSSLFLFTPYLSLLVYLLALFVFLFVPFCSVLFLLGHVSSCFVSLSPV